jgi:Protein of unknown function, DUF417
MTTYVNRSFIERITDLATIETIGSVLSRYGLVLVIGWIGALKFANFEAHQIQPLVSNSPFMGWLYDFLPVYTFSALLGVVELTAAVLLAMKPIAPKLSIGGSQLPVHDSGCFRTIGRWVPRTLSHGRVPAERRPAAWPFILELGRRHQGRQATLVGGGLLAAPLNPATLYTDTPIDDRRCRQRHRRAAPGTEHFDND